MIGHHVDVCVIEDDAQQRDLLVARLKAMQYSVIEAAHGLEGLRAIYQQRPRIVICDLMLPEMDGIQICRHLRGDPTLDGTYVIVVTAHDRDGRKKEALVAGADDYLRKPYDVDELLARIRNGFRLHRLQERLQRAALTDGLTGLWNHSQFRLQLDREFARSRRYNSPTSLLMIDIDHFKAINDTYGHELGNRALRGVARFIARTARDTDLLARYGGEEFAVICPETTIDDAEQLAERLRQGLPNKLRLQEQPHLALRVSIGVASTEDPRAGCVADLIDLSDQALYHSKRTGRDRVTRADKLANAPQLTEMRIDEVDRLRKEVVALSMKSKELCLQSVWALIQALEARDGYSAWHSRNVTTYTRWLMKAAGWGTALTTATANAAMLHDLGKIGLPDELLLKPQPLTRDEAALVRQVPLITCKILEPLRVFETEIQFIRHLRERFDGSGSPDGLAGSSIPLASRMIAVTEAFDSLTCNRAYRPGYTLDEALRILEEAANTQFDPDFVTLLRTQVEADRQRWERQIARARIGVPPTLVVTVTE